MIAFKKNIFSIAGLSLQINSPIVTSLPAHFKKFISPLKKPLSSPWRLQSIAVQKKKTLKLSNNLKQKLLKIKSRFTAFKRLRQEWRKQKANLLKFKFPLRLNHPLNASFYFNQPVFIDVRRKKITHFYLEDEKNAQPEAFDARLITYAYSQILAVNKGLLLHCAAVAKNKQAYIFFGAPGAGKSTVASLSQSYQVLGDDVIAVRKIKESFFAFSTPWTQRPFIQPVQDLFSPVKAIFFLKKSKRINFTALSQEETLVRIFRHHLHFLFYTERPLIDKLFFTSAEFVKTTPAYLMEFKKDENFWPELEKL